MLSQMQQRRAERKKPKRFVALKKVSLDASQQHSISTAQTNMPKHPITQMHVGRSSTAFVNRNGVSWPYSDYHWCLLYRRSN